MTGPTLLDYDQQRRFTAELARTGSRAFALAACRCTLRDATYTRDRRPRFEIEWRRAEWRARERLSR